MTIRSGRRWPASPMGGSRRTLLSILGLLLTALPLTAQSWPQSKGMSYLKLSYGSSTARDQFTFDGRQKEYADNVDDNAFFDRSIYAYGELGLTDNITLLGSLPYKRLIIRDAAFRYRTFGIGSAQIGARVGLKPYLGLDSLPFDALAANVMLTLPTGYTRNLTPSVGSGQADAELYLSYGRSFYPLDAYAQAGVGYRYRSSIYGLSKAVPCQEGSDKDCVADRTPVYGDEVLSSTAGRVVGVLDRLPDRPVDYELPPGTAADAGGNHVVVDMGGGRYVFYGHLMPGSVRVRVGHRVTVGQVLGDRLRAAVGDHPLVRDVRGRGMFWGIELGCNRDLVVRAALERDLWVYPAGSGPVPNAVMVAPPFVITDAEIDQIGTRLRDALDHVAAHPDVQPVPVR